MVKRTLRSLPAVAALLAVYFVASKLGLKLAVLHPSATAVWPGTGIALAALVVFGIELWPAILIGSFLVNLTTAGTILTSIGIAGGNTLEAVLGAYLVARFAGGRQAFDNAENVFKYALFGAILNTALAATCGVGSLALGGQLGAADPRLVWITWWMGDMVGALVLAPFLILWSSREAWENPWPDWRGTAAALSLLFVGALLFGEFLPSRLQNFPLAFLCIPLIVWGSFHLRAHQASAAILLLSAISISGSLRGIGRLPPAEQNESLLLLQVFMAVIAMTSLVVSAAVFERERDATSRILSESRLRLAQRAAEIGTWEWDPANNRNSLSAEMHEMFGTRDTDADRSALWESRVHPDDGAKVRQELQAGNDAGSLEFEYRYQHPERGLRWFYCKGARLIPEESCMFGVVLDITERKRVEEALLRAREDLENKVSERTADLRKAERSLRALSSRLLQMQDEERRRIARELHDSSGQVLAALNLNLAAVQRESDKLSPRALRSLQESLESVEMLSQELRTMSHLLHPPLLDELGLVSAVRWYVEGFAERSKISVALQIDSGLGRMSRELETTIFRIVQECLTNVHRHAGSPTAKVSILADAESVNVTVSDDGKGISPDLLDVRTETVQPGVGIQGMRERVRQLGGRLEIRSAVRGTVVAAMLPWQLEPEIHAATDADQSAGDLDR